MHRPRGAIALTLAVAALLLAVIAASTSIIIVKVQTDRNHAQVQREHASQLLTNQQIIQAITSNNGKFCALMGVLTDPSVPHTNIPLLHIEQQLTIGLGCPLGSNKSGKTSPATGG